MPKPDGKAEADGKKDNKKGVVQNSEEGTTLAETDHS